MTHKMAQTSKEVPENFDENKKNDYYLNWIKMIKMNVIKIHPPILTK